MKTLIYTAKTCALLLLMLLASCKKEKTEPVNTTVTVEDLLGYQLYWGLIAPDNTVNLRLLYFTKVGNDIIATLDGITSRNILNAVVQNNILTLDLNGNGSVVYTFEFQKNKEGIKLKTVKFYNVNNPDYKIGDGAAFHPLTNFSSVKNNAYVNGKGTIVKFNSDTWLSGAYPNITGTYYECGKGGFKGKINGVDHMGICMNIDGVNGFLLQKVGDENLSGYMSF